jgi:hypothetical protein
MSRSKLDHRNPGYIESVAEESEDIDEYDEDDESEAEEEHDSLQHDHNGQNPDEKYSHLPLYQRLQLLQEDHRLPASTSTSTRSHHQHRRLQKKSHLPTSSSASDTIDNENDTNEKQKKDKNAPAVGRSHRPVPILRENSNLVHKPKFVDPRFSEATGKLNYYKFIKNYSFLDEAQEKEIAGLEKKVKKIKNHETKETLKRELDK